MRRMLRRSELCPAIEVDGDHPANVCNSKVRTTNEFVVGKPRVQPGEKMLDSRTAAFGQRGDMLLGVRPGQGMPLQPWSGIAKRFHRGVKAIPLEAALPRLCQRLFFCSTPHQPRLG